MGATTKPRAQKTQPKPWPCPAKWVILTLPGGSVLMSTGPWSSALSTSTWPASAATKTGVAPVDPAAASGAARDFSRSLRWCTSKMHRSLLYIGHKSSERIHHQQQQQQRANYAKKPIAGVQAPCHFHVTPLRRNGQRRPFRRWLIHTCSCWKGSPTRQVAQRMKVSGIAMQSLPGGTTSVPCSRNDINVAVIQYLFCFHRRTECLLFKHSSSESRFAPAWRRHSTAVAWPYFAAAHRALRPSASQRLAEARCCRSSRRTCEA